MSHPPPTLPPEIAAALSAALERVNPDVYCEIAAALARVYAPACRLSCWEWAHANIRLTPEESRDHHGPYDGSLTIYIKRVMDFVTAPADREKELIIRKSAQLGFTLAYLIVICYVAATRPTHVLFGMDSAKEARNISERLQRLLTTNPALAGTFTEEGEDDLQNLLLRLRGMLVHLAGSGSPGAYANKSVGLVILDELDKHMPMPGKHANTIDLGRDRIKKVQQGKIIAGGTPASWDGECNQNFLTGTREELHAPCPHCDHFQPFRWEQMRFEHCKDLTGQWDYARLLSETYLECEVCHRPIRNDDKPRILPRAVWVAHNDGKDDWKPVPGRCSIWISDLYSQDPQTTWGHLAVKWIDAQKSPSKLISFFNETLGRPRQEAKTEVTKSDLHKLNGGYRHGCIPKRPAINPESGAAAIVMGCDNQGSGEKKWVKVGLTYDGEAFVVDYGRCMSFQELLVEADEPVWVGMEPPPDAEVQAARDAAITEGRDFLAVLRERFPDREFHTVSVGFIDEGHDTFVVRDFCHSTGDPSAVPPVPPRFFPCKGISRVHAVSLVEEIPNKFRTTKTDEGPFITVYHFSDDDLKRDLYIGRIAGFDAIKSGKSAVPRLWFPAYAEDEFLTELTQEKRAQIRYKGRLVWMWQDPKGPNDWGDAVKMSLALWHVIKAQFPAPLDTAKAA
jgi:phage terminase large subunit GpA-like protein